MFLDTTIIMEILRSKKRSKKFQEIFDLVKDEPLFISVIQLGEISDWCLDNEIDPLDRISRLKEVVGIVPLSERICLEGSEIKRWMRERGVSKFSVLDGIILVSARSIDQKLLTTDSDFRKAEDAIILD
ncbi:MAG: type II toxin-antitoxin system VapC family toxin [Thermoplasmata archaeon]